MFNKILIANRGEIACRVARTARRMGIATVAVYSEADAASLHVEACDEAVCIGPAAASESYLRAEHILEVARATGAQAVHPGYGFLSENAAFARACEQAGIVFIGPPASAIDAMGSKTEAKQLMEAAGVPLVPGYHGDDQDDALLQAESGRIGFPQLIKASAGGGGKGMRIVESAVEFPQALASARREALASFGNEKVLIERYLTAPRHVELQVFADGHGNAVHLFERDCSIQRRHQKVLEEAPAPGMTEALRSRMAEAAINSARAINYRGAGTVEFLLDEDGSFYFMEMNTRLQVEHPVSEMITRVDLVEWQLRVAAGEALPLAQQDIKLHGHAFEARVYAEYPERDFLPSTGRLQYLSAPDTNEQVRIDTGVRQGDDIGVNYDPMISKLIVWGEDRDTALARMQRALVDYRIMGLQTNLGFLGTLFAHADFAGADFDTGFIAKQGEALFMTDERDTERAELLAAAYLLAKTLDAGDADDPVWANNDGWRLNLPTRMTLRFTADSGERVFTATPGSGPWRIESETVSESVDTSLAGDEMTLRLGDERLQVPVIDDAESFTLWYAGRQWSFQYFDPAAAARGGGETAGDLIAPMPGNVIELAVAVGDEVKDGDKLIVVEAMKMEHTIVAPMDGVVKEVFFQEGDQVEEGEHLVLIANAE